MKGKISLIIAAAACASVAFAQTDRVNNNKFKQLYEELPTPNAYRTAAGAPGYMYYQQKADYDMDIVLDDENQRISGVETITYTNNSPDQLEYLWIQLDQNRRAPDSEGYAVQKQQMDERMSFNSVARWHKQADFEGGFNIEHVKNSSGKAMNFHINKTMMRINLPEALKSGQKISFEIKWWYNINNRDDIGGRSGYEYFAEEDNYLYTIAQFFPRMAVYNDVDGWQNKQFLGRGEFTLPFGDYIVNITVPEDHIVGATGVLKNGSSVLTSTQRKRFEEAKTADAPVLIVTQEEAEEAEKEKSSSTKKWTFEAENVRDFAFATSRKFMWDAQGIKQNGKTVMCMSYYPKEGNPLWEKYSTKVVAHTIKSFSKYTIDYDYPVAISVHSKSIGMEYPMICFNGGRPEADGTYSERTKYGMISVIIHEVGHNFFPMIINSDERQWTWMDEGLNTFVQYLAEMEWDVDYPSRRGPAPKIVPYMKMDASTMMPIMTNSESILQFGNNAYGKPATALNILRETILGRENFDYAFKTYCERWAYKHPTPADFFRTMEDASGTDLDWFWRGWFYTTEPCDQSIVNMEGFLIDTKDPEEEAAYKKMEYQNRTKAIGEMRNEAIADQTVVATDEETVDFYNTNDPWDYTLLDVQDYDRYINKLSEEELELLNSGNIYYQMDFENVGGLVMPIILNITLESGEKVYKYIPAEIWKNDDAFVSKVFWFKEPIMQVELDPFLETADIDRSNNYWPHRTEMTKFQMYQSRQSRKYGGGAGGMNPMQRAKKSEELQR